MSNYGGKSRADKKINKDAAKIACQDPLMRAVAEKVLNQIKANAEGSREDGAYIDSLDIVLTPRGRTGITDQRVIARDPEAKAKEYGHFETKEGGRRHVPGHFYMTQAAAVIEGGL